MRLARPFIEIRLLRTCAQPQLAPKAFPDLRLIYCYASPVAFPAMIAPLLVYNNGIFQGDRPLLQFLMQIPHLVHICARSMTSTTFCRSSSALLSSGDDHDMAVSKDRCPSFISLQQCGSHILLILRLTQHTQSIGHTGERMILG